MTRPHLTIHLANRKPESYRVKYDGIEIGSISEREQIVGKIFWHWGVDTMYPATPSGQARTLDEAKEDFRMGFTAWLNSLPPGGWEKASQHHRKRQSK